jgi:hypothetical protein
MADKFQITMACYDSMGNVETMEQVEGETLYHVLSLIPTMVYECMYNIERYKNRLKCYEKVEEVDTYDFPF